MSLVQLALKRSYTFIVMAILIVLATPFALLNMATDIFPEINIPVVSVIWSYNGLSAQEMGQRIAASSERGLSTVVNDIEHIESTSLNGIAIIKIFFQPKANIQLAISQVVASVQAQVRQKAEGGYRTAAVALDFFLPRKHTAPARIGRKGIRVKARRNIASAIRIGVVAPYAAWL
jgi:multidrug efflux pump subunit AcrB